MAVQMSENDQGASEVTKDVPGNSNAAMSDRLLLLEKEYKQLSALFVDYLAAPRNEDREEMIDAVIPALPACEIAHISSIEWRDMHYRETPQVALSLITVSTKGRGDDVMPNHSVQTQAEAGKSVTELSPEFTKISTLSTGKPYRIVLNGRPEFMGVLSSMFGCQAMPGYYIWIWPFKYLIRYEMKVRARLVEEEAKFADDDKMLTLEHKNKADVQHVSQQAEDSRESSANDEALAGNHSKGFDLKATMKPNEESTSAGLPSPIQDADVKVEGGEVMIEETVQGNLDSANKKTRRAESSSSNQSGDVKTEETVENTGPGVSESARQRTRRVEPTRLRDELRCLVRFMDEDMKDIFLTHKGIEDGTLKKISFDYLWLLFKPGDVVLSAAEHNRAYIVVHVTGGRALDRVSQSTSHEKSRDVYPYITKEQEREKEAYLAKYPKTTPIVIDCFYIDFDGTNFGPLPQKFMLAEYEGEVPIKSLEVFPMRFDDNPQQTEKALVKRGKRLVKLARVDHKYYSGKTIREPRILELQEEVHGEVMIDFALAINYFRKSQRERYSSDRWDVKFGTGVIANPTQVDEREISTSFRVLPSSAADFQPLFLMEDPAFDDELRTDFIDKTTLLKERPYQDRLSNKVLSLLPPRVYGFSLLDRKWCAFDLMKVEDIKNSGQGFENLVLSDDHKRIMQALVQNHMNSPAPLSSQISNTVRDFSMDVVRGKGKGLIVLLHGVPGVGKTSTAECVAAQTKRPLFPITCGDIGTSPSQVEEKLSEYFDMAHKWGCVLLLDEADVFLAKRERGGDLERNGVVSVFLRVLEYYSGILILTTNRIGEFDEAFSSRVHIKLYYPKLDRKSTLAIWKMNMKRILESDLNITVEEDQIKKFARKLWAEGADRQTQRWNGRQIRNAFQSAIALAKWDYQEDGINEGDRPVLSVRQFEVVAQTSSHFDAYISTMHGVEESGDPWEIIAARDLLRRSDTPRKPTARSLAMAKQRGGKKKVEIFEDEEDDDDTDSDENEEKMKKLRAEIEKLEKMKKPSPKKPRHSDGAQEVQRVIPQVKVEDEDSSSMSDDAE